MAAVTWWSPFRARETISVRPNRNISPSQNLATLVRGGLVEPLDALAPTGAAGEENATDSVGSHLWEIDAEIAAPLPKEGVGHLHKYAGAVAAVGVGPGCTSMRQVYKYLQAVAYGRVRSAPPDIDDEPDPAGIMFIGRIIKSQFFIHLGSFHFLYNKMLFVLHAFLLSSDDVFAVWVPWQVA